MRTPRCSRPCSSRARSSLARRCRAAAAARSRGHPRLVAVQRIADLREQLLALTLCGIGALVGGGDRRRRRTRRWLRDLRCGRSVADVLRDGSFVRARHHEQRDREPDEHHRCEDQPRGRMLLRQHEHVDGQARATAETIVELAAEPSHTASVVVARPPDAVGSGTTVLASSAPATCRRARSRRTRSPSERSRQTHTRRRSCRAASRARRSSRRCR